MQVRCPQFREDLKCLRDSKGKRKVDGGEMNVVDNGSDEFLMTETPMDGILREEKPKWVLDNAASSHICNDRAMFETLNGKGQFGEIKVRGISKCIEDCMVSGSVRFSIHDGNYVDGEDILTFGIAKALRDNERMTGSDSSSSRDKLLVAYDSGRGRNFQRGSSKGRSKSRMGEWIETMGVVSMLLLRGGKTKVGNAESSHICNDRAMFETLNGKGQFGEIKVGSKQMMKIEGVGSVRFKLHDGSVKTALNVKYVPGAARNILSLGVLTSRGYRYVGRKDTCKVYKRDQLVIRERKIPNNLCYLEREALQGRTCCGGNKRKKNIDKRVHFSDKDEVLGILSKGRIY
ncbi:hypothetical protein Tco_0590936 [Tanacetum coccineum]